MAELPAIRAQLARVRAELPTSLVLATGRPDDETKADEEAKRLERISGTLAIVLRDLQSAENLLHLREKQLRQVPPEHRFSAQQSLNQMIQNIRDLSDIANALATQVRDLLDRNGLLDPALKAKKLLELAENLDKVFGPEAHQGLAQVLQPKQPVLSPGSTGAAPLTISGVTGLIAFVYVATKVLQKKLSNKTTSA